MTEETPDRPVMGRPTKYDPGYAKQCEQLCKLGATVRELAEFFEVDIRTVERWAAEHKDFCRALNKGRKVANQRVARSLYQRAVGYSVDCEKIFMHEGKPVRVKTMEHYPPEVAAMIFWLKNREPNHWRDVKNIQKTVTKTRVQAGNTLHSQLQRALEKRTRPTTN